MAAAQALELIGLPEARINLAQAVIHLSLAPTSIAVLAGIAATDEAAMDASPASIVRMHGAFTRATQLEWMFWDGAYREVAWPV